MSPASSRNEARSGGDGLASTASTVAMFQSRTDFPGSFLFRLRFMAANLTFENTARSTGDLEGSKKWAVLSSPVVAASWTLDSSRKPCDLAILRANGYQSDTNFDCSGVRGTVSMT